MTADLRDELVALTCDLVRFPSTADRPDQLAAVSAYVDHYLSRIPGLFVERSEVGAKPAIVATLRDTRAPAVMLNGHLDVVMARPEQYQPELRDGRIYGRGAQDMKGSVAVMLRLLRDLAALPTPPDVGFQFVSDEEIGGALGSARLLDEGWRCGALLCLEPTDMGVIYEHKGAMWIELRLPGAPAHGSRPWDGRNPIQALAAGLAAVEQRFPTPTSELYRTTVTPTALHTAAGSRNQVPSGIELTFDIRWTVDTPPEQIEAAISACFPTAELLVSACGVGLKTDPEDPAVLRLADLLETRLGQPPRLFREHFATDARFYSAAGIPAVCVGPVGAGLHSDEEWVSIDSLIDLYHVLRDYIEQ